MFKAVLFDMDGVMIDSEPLHTAAFQESMKAFGLDLSNEYCEQFIGNTDLYMCEVLVKDFHLTCTPEDLLQAKKESLKAYEKTHPYPVIPFIPELVRNLYDNGIKLAIASSSPMEAIKKTARDLGLEDCFSEYVSGMELKRSKPAPDIFLKAALMLNVSNEDCLVIEDSEHGVQAAKSAGMTCVGFINPNSGNQNLSKADILVEGFEEIDYNFLYQIYQHSHNLPATIAKTERIILRELCLDDIKPLHEIYQSKKVREFLNDFEDIETETKKLEAYIKYVYQFLGYGFWGVFDANTNQLIGRCGIQNNDIEHTTEIELGYLIDESLWGQGYATEAAQCALSYAIDTLEIHRVVAAIDKNNTRSINVAKKLGMHYEKDVFYYNCMCDLYVIEA